MTESQQPDPPALRISHVSKRFGATQAVRDVSLDVASGEIHGLLGQNGAGKSTLMKIVYGLYPPDDGVIELHGTPVEMESPQDAMRRGIGMVHQHLSVIHQFDVWENVVLGEPVKIRRAAILRELRELSDRYGFEIDPHAKLGDLSAGEQQRVEIIKCLRRDPSIIILDEPTSILTPMESERLFEILRDISESEGRAIVLISHKLDELLDVTDRITVMRDGQLIRTIPTVEATPSLLAREMVAEDTVAARLLELGDEATREPAEDDVDQSTSQRPLVLEVRGATAIASGGRRLLDGCSLEVREGEVVGVAGVQGNGQAPLEYLLSSLLTADEGEVRVAGEPVPLDEPGAMRRAGVAVIAGDRHASGSAVGMTLSENIIIHERLRGQVRNRGFLRRRQVKRLTERLISEHRIKTSSHDAPFWTLSGGNQQRAVMARELADRPRVLVAAQPTRGLDIAAAEETRQHLLAAADEGVGVLLISTDLDEIITLSDRVIVMSRGQVIGELASGQIDHERLGLLLGGSTADRSDSADRPDPADTSDAADTADTVDSGENEFAGTS